MKWCVTFPEETIMVVRPSLIAICMGDKSAAYLLSVLLYRYSIRREGKDDAENLNELRSSQGEEPSQDTTYHIYRKQSQLVADMCGVITEKTLHDVAVPMLQLLGYLDIEEHLQCNRYTLHIDAVEAALVVYKNQRSTLEIFLIEQLRLEKFLIDKNYFQSQLGKFLMTSEDLEKPIAELEKVLIDKKKFQLQLEKVLIQNRKSSNCARGRKASPKAVSEGNPEIPKSNKSSNKSSIKSIDTAIADTHTSLSSEMSLADLEALVARYGFALQPKEPAANPGKNISESNPKPAKPTRKRTSKEKPAKPEPPQMPASDMAWSAHKCLLLFDAWRGATLIGHYKIKEAETCAKGLAEQYTEEQVRAVYKAMNELDYWQARGGADICNVANNISKEIKKGKPVEISQPGDAQIYWNTTGKKRCMDPDLWRWMSVSEALSFGYAPDQKLTEREIRDTETRRLMKREIEARKEQETAHG